VELWTAFLLGLVGSLHCAGMCGPLALALPVTGTSTASHVLSRVTYNLGRILTYGLLGVIFGLVGKSLALAGVQRWVSLASGVAILLGLLASSRFALGQPAARFVVWLKAGLSRLLRRRSLSALFGLGLLNGLLPCGLVYVACAGAVAMGGFLSSVEYMVSFGLGTLPMMLGLGLASRTLSGTFRLKFQKAIPVCLVLLSCLLILRSMSLGIPYVSPDLTGGGACH